MMDLLKPRHHWQATRELVGLLTRHRQLTWEMAKREVLDHYAGRALGAVWAIGHPLIQAAVYLGVFGFVFRPDIQHPHGSPLDWPVYLLSGLIPWLAMMESMNKASVSMVSNANLVKQVVFPIEVLPVKGVLVALIPQAVMTLLLVSYMVLRLGVLPWTMVLLPLLVFWQVLAMIGIGYMLAPIGGYLRDLRDVVHVFGLVGIYLIPAFYLPQMVPAVFRPLLYLNPFSYMLWCYQDVFYFGAVDHPWAWIVFAVSSLLVFHFGYRMFRSLKVYLGDVL